MLRLAAELLAQHRVLRRNANRTGIQVTLAHHDAAERDQRCRGKPDLFCTQQRGNHDIPAGLDPAIGLQNHPASQVVHHQRLMRFGKPQLPG